MTTTSQNKVGVTSFVYDPKLDRFLGSDGTVYTCEEMDLLDKMERDHTKSQPYYSFFDWVKVFDGEQKQIARALRDRVNVRKDHLTALEGEYELDIELAQDVYRRNQTPETFRAVKEMIARLEREREVRTAPLKNEIAVMVSRINFLLGKKNTSARITDEDIERAKATPIVSLIKVGRDHKALCPFHADTKPSLHVYRDNHAYCFVCEKQASAIDIYMGIHACDFKTAVKALCL